MTETIEWGPRRPWRHTVSRSTTKAHDRAVWRASRVWAEATSSRYGRSGTGHRVPCPRRTLARARRTTMRLAGASALRARRPAPGLRAAAPPATLRHVHTRPAGSRAARWVGTIALVALLLGVSVGANAQECVHALLLPVDTTIT